MAPEPPATPRSVLVGSDLSESSDQIVRHAAQIAARCGAALHVVSAYPPVSSSMGGVVADEPTELEIAEIRRALPAQLRRILPENRQPETAEVRFGSPGQVILARAVEIEADLIVLGAHRGTDVHAQFLGTTADEVLRASRVPCLALRGFVPFPVSRMGVATDFSPDGDRALHYAVAWHRWLNGMPAPAEERSVLRAVHIVQPQQRGTIDECRARLEALLKERSAELGEVEVDFHVDVLAARDVPAALVEWALREGLEVIFAGTQGKSRVERMILGSVSSALARRAPCPVLLIPQGQGRES